MDRRTSNRWLASLLRSSAARMSVLFLAIGSAAGASGLSMDDAVSAALERAPALAARRASEKAAGAEVQVARSAWWPRLGFEVSYLFRDPRNELPLDLPDLPQFPEVGEIDDVHHVKAGLTVSHLVFDLSRDSRVDAAKHRFAAELAATEIQRADLAFAVRATFLSALLAREVRQVAQTSRSVAEEELRRAQLRQETGVSSRLEVAQARVRTANLSAQEAEAESELSRQRARLESLLGLSSVPPLKGQLVQLAPRSTARLDDSSGGKEPGASLHPELARLEALAEASDALAEARGRALIPTLSAFASARLEYPRALQLELGPVWEVGAMLSWSIFDGFAREGEVKAHRARQSSFQELSEARLEEIRRRLVDLQSRDRTAQARLRSARRILEENEVYLRVARAAVAAGTGTDLDVLTAELGMDAARVDERKALFERALVGAEALRAQGRWSSSGGEDQ